jgi:MYND finger/Ankyrin repeats (3 copies)
MPLCRGCQKPDAVFSAAQKKRSTAQRRCRQCVQQQQHTAAAVRASGLSAAFPSAHIPRSGEIAPEPHPTNEVVLLLDMPPFVATYFASPETGICPRQVLLQVHSRAYVAQVLAGTDRATLSDLVTRRVVGAHHKLFLGELARWEIISDPDRFGQEVRRVLAQNHALAAKPFHVFEAPTEEHIPDHFKLLLYCSYFPQYEAELYALLARDGAARTRLSPLVMLPAELAARRGHSGVVRHIVEKYAPEPGSADPDVIGNAVAWAAYGSHMHVFDFLVKEKRADPNYAAAEGDSLPPGVTALHMAVINQQWPLAKALISDYGADVHAGSALGSVVDLLPKVAGLGAKLPTWARKLQQSGGAAQPPSAKVAKVCGRCKSSDNAFPDFPPGVCSVCVARSVRSSAGSRRPGMASTQQGMALSRAAVFQTVAAGNFTVEERGTSGEWRDVDPRVKMPVEGSRCRARLAQRIRLPAMSPDDFIQRLARGEPTEFDFHEFYSVVQELATYTYLFPLFGSRDARYLEGGPLYLMGVGEIFWSLALIWKHSVLSCSAGPDAADWPSLDRAANDMSWSDREIERQVREIEHAPPPRGTTIEFSSSSALAGIRLEALRDRVGKEWYEALLNLPQKHYLLMRTLWLDVWKGAADLTAIPCMFDTTPVGCAAGSSCPLSHSDTRLADIDQLRNVPRLCGAPKCRNVAFSWCSGCKRVFFCSRDCQRAAWPAHRSQCGR